MRLISQFREEEKAQAFLHLLQDQKIDSYLEASAKDEEVQFLIWIVDEDDFARAESLFSDFTKDQAHYIKKAKEIPPPIKVQQPAPEPKAILVGMPRNMPRRGLTRMLLFICVFLFLWMNVEERQVLNEKGMLYLQVGLTPLEQKMFYDYPERYLKLSEVLSNFKLESMNDLSTLPSKMQEQVHRAEKTSSWEGIYPYFEKRLSDEKGELKAPMFEKIKQGELWRLVTPIFLHRDFLHILFNMCWLWIIGFQIEERLGKLRMLFLIILIAIVSDTLQYLMSGPFFIGFSGVLCGLVGFIWQRQKKASWEGYPLNRSTISFLAYFVIAIALLQLIAFILKVTGVIEVTPQIANTAHISGAIAGILLGRTKLFARTIG